MPIKLGTKELKLPGIEKIFLGSTLVYLANQDPTNKVGTAKVGTAKAG